ncbi:hypothetical protein ACM66B_002772 [Microbotryomycetes sp. NB124-2]
MPFNKYQPWGLVCSDNVYDPASSCQLEAVHVAAHVRDLSATVKLSQQYKSMFTAATSCTYLFPVPHRAVVTSFAMLKQDGKRVIGIVQEKKQAQITYDDAVEQGKLASLASEETPDTFSLKIGNILPQERVTIELTYATELTEDETNDSIRLHIPAYIGDRYGNGPAHVSNVSSGAFTKFELEASFEMLSPIRQISSPSHPVTTTLGPDPAIDDSDNIQVANFARINFSTSSTLDKDIVIAVKATGLDSPRCTLEQHANQGSAALRLTFVPKFELSPLQEQEYLFLVDRSGSMGGERIEMARKALVVMLRSLPAKGTSFNVLSFGSSSDSLWKRSKVYDQDSLAQATKHVDAMDANFGGTEMNAALKYTFERRDQAIPTSVILLTDGDAWDLDNVFETVSSAVKNSKQLLRAFVLGIGDSASTAMCEGIARRGNGTTQFVVDGENFTGKTARLLKAAKSRPFKHVELELPGVDAIQVAKDETSDDFVMLDKPDAADSKPSTPSPAAAAAEPKTLFDEFVDPIDTTLTDLSLTADDKEATRLPDLAAVQQAPHKIENLYPGTRLNVYILLQRSALSSGLPRRVILKARLDESSEALKLDVPIQPSTASAAAVRGVAGSYPLHSLAARKLVQNLSDGQHDLKVDLPRTSFQSEAVKQKALDKLVNSHIVGLGTTYGIASKETSFVAVDEDEEESVRSKRRVHINYRVENRPTPVPSWGGGGGARFARSGPGGAAPKAMMFRAAAAVPPPPAQYSPAPGSAGPALFRSAAVAQPMASMATSSAAPFGAAKPTAPPSPFLSKSAIASTVRGYGTVAETDAAATSYSFAPPRLPPFGSTTATTTSTWSSNSAAANKQNSADEEVDVVNDLARYQQFDGAFDVQVLSKLVKLTTTTDLNELKRSWQTDSNCGGTEVDEVVLVTVVVLLVWEERAGERKDEWEAMAEKGWEHVRNQLANQQVTENRLTAWARKVVTRT